MRLRPLDEQPHGGRLRQRFQAAVLLRQRQRQDRIGVFPGHAQGLAARCQDAHLRRGRQRGRHQSGSGLDHLLAVIQNQQQPLGPEVRAKCLQQRPTGLLRHPEHARRFLRHARAVADRRQIDEPGAVRVLRHHFGRHL